jgi:Neutral/alkaline non-lysosomal ceramidase, N-terminal
VRGEVIGCSILLGLLFGGASIGGIADATERCTTCVTAGAAYVALRVPPGTPLAGYGGMQRRLVFPDVFDRYAHAFWFRPSVGEHDSIAARALVLESRAARLAWVTLDLIAVDGSFTRAVQGRLARAGVPEATLIVSASHTHSGPGAFMDSELRGVIAVDRLDPVVREALVEGVVTAVRRADGARAPALVAATRVTAPAVTTSRLGKPLDSEIVVVKVTSAAGEPRALVWNFAIHGTMLPAANLHLSGDVMGVTSALLEKRLGAPALFVNGAVGDVSPAAHGVSALRATAGALAAAVEAGWAQAKPVPVTTLRVARRTVPLPRPAVSLKRCVGRWMPGFLAIPLGFELPAETELLAAAVGDTAWVTIPGELQTSFGQAIKREARGLFASVFLAGLSNDYLGYFMTLEDTGRRGYVACATLYGPDAGACLTDAAIELLYRLGERPRPLTRPSPRCGSGSGTR